jgi:hypothetical protein
MTSTSNSDFKYIKLNKRRKRQLRRLIEKMRPALESLADK